MVTYFSVFIVWRLRSFTLHAFDALAKLPHDSVLDCNTNGFVEPAVLFEEKQRSWGSKALSQTIRLNRIANDVYTCYRDQLFRTWELFQKPELQRMAFKRLENGIEYCKQTDSLRH